MAGQGAVVAMADPGEEQFGHVQIPVTREEYDEFVALTRDIKQLKKSQWGGKNNLPWNNDCLAPRKIIKGQLTYGLSDSSSTHLLSTRRQRLLTKALVDQPRWEGGTVFTKNELKNSLPVVDIMHPVLNAQLDGDTFATDEPLRASVRLWSERNYGVSKPTFQGMLGFSTRYKFTSSIISHPSTIFHALHSPWLKNNYVKRFTDPDGVLGKTGTALLLPISKFAGVQKIPNHKERMEVSHLLPDAWWPNGLLGAVRSYSIDNTLVLSAAQNRTESDMAPNLYWRSLTEEEQIQRLRVLVDTWTAVGRQPSNEIWEGMAAFMGYQSETLGQAEAINMIKTRLEVVTTTQALPAFVGPEGLAADTEEPFAPEFQLSEAMDYDDELAKPWEIADAQLQAMLELKVGEMHKEFAAVHATLDQILRLQQIASAPAPAEAALQAELAEAQAEHDRVAGQNIDLVHENQRLRTQLAEQQRLERKRRAEEPSEPGA